MSCELDAHENRALEKSKSENATTRKGTARRTYPIGKQQNSDWESSFCETRPFGPNGSTTGDRLWQGMGASLPATPL